MEKFVVLESLGRLAGSLVGSFGAHKSLVDEADPRDSLLTSDVAALLDSLDLRHTAAAMVREACQAHTAEHGAGATSLVALTGLLSAGLRRALEEGVDSWELAEALQVAQEIFVTTCNHIKVPIDREPGSHAEAARRATAAGTQFDQPLGFPAKDRSSASMLGADMIGPVGDAINNSGDSGGGGSGGSGGDLDAGGDADDVLWFFDTDDDGSVPVCGSAPPRTPTMKASLQPRDIGPSSAARRRQLAMAALAARLDHGCWWSASRSTRMNQTTPVTTSAAVTAAAVSAGAVEPSAALINTDGIAVDGSSNNDGHTLSLPMRLAAEAAEQLVDSRGLSDSSPAASGNSSFQHRQQPWPAWDLKGVQVHRFVGLSPSRSTVSPSVLIAVPPALSGDVKDVILTGPSSSAAGCQQPGEEPAARAASTGRPRNVVSGRIALINASWTASALDDAGATGSDSARAQEGLAVIQSADELASLHQRRDTQGQHAIGLARRLVSQGVAAVFVRGEVSPAVLDSCGGLLLVIPGVPLQDLEALAILSSSPLLTHPDQFDGPGCGSRASRTIALTLRESGWVPEGDALFIASSSALAASSRPTVAAKSESSVTETYVEATAMAADTVGAYAGGVVSVVIHGYGQPVAKEIESRFWRSLHRLRGAWGQGDVLPGAASTEVFAAASMRAMARHLSTTTSASGSAAAVSTRISAASASAPLVLVLDLVADALAALAGLIVDNQDPGIRGQATFRGVAPSPAASARVAAAEAIGAAFWTRCLATALLSSSWRLGSGTATAASGLVETVRRCLSTATGDAVAAAAGCSPLASAHQHGDAVDADQNRTARPALGETISDCYLGKVSVFRHAVSLATLALRTDLTVVLHTGA